MSSVLYRLRRRLGCDSPLSHRHRRLPRGWRAHPVPLPLHRRQGPLRGPSLYRISGREFETGLRHATKSLIIQENDLYFQLKNYPLSADLSEFAGLGAEVSAGFSAAPISFPVPLHPLRDVIDEQRGCEWTKHVAGEGMFLYA